MNDGNVKTEYSINKFTIKGTSWINSIFKKEKRAYIQVHFIFRFRIKLIYIISFSNYMKTTHCAAASAWTQSKTMEWETRKVPTTKK